MSCRTFGNVTICGPSKWVEFSRDSVGIKWCFQCRKHLEYFWIVEGDPEPNYYGPSARYSCSACNGDHTLGFGRVYTWEDDE